jgi:hypothetical protein
MNANKLADWLFWWTEGKPYPQEFPKIIETLRLQQAEIEALKKLKADKDALDKKLFKSIQKSSEMWDKAANSILRKAKVK